MYGVKFVGDDELPDGHDFALVRMRGGGMVFFFKASRITEDLLECAWEAYRAAVVDLPAPDPRPGRLQSVPCSA